MDKNLTPLVLQWMFNALFADFGVNNNLFRLMLDLEGTLDLGLRTIPSSIFVSLTKHKPLLPVSGSIHLIVPSNIIGSLTNLKSYYLSLDLFALI